MLSSTIYKIIQKVLFRTDVKYRQKTVCIGKGISRGRMHGEEKNQGPVPLEVRPRCGNSVLCRFHFYSMESEMLPF